MTNAESLLSDIFDDTDGYQGAQCAVGPPMKACLSAAACHRRERVRVVGHR